MALSRTQPYYRNVLDECIKAKGYSRQGFANIIFGGEPVAKARLNNLEFYEKGYSTVKGIDSNWMKMAALLGVDVDWLTSGNHALEYARLAKYNPKLSADDLSLTQKKFRDMIYASDERSGANHSPFSRTLSGKGSQNTGKISLDTVIDICSYLKLPYATVFPYKNYKDFYRDHLEINPEVIPSGRSVQLNL